MIAGEFDGTRRPIVVAHVWFIASDVHLSVTFLVDVQSEETRISAPDASFATKHLPLDDASTEADGTLSWSMPAIVTFADDSRFARTGYFAPIRIVHDPDAESRLGRDILNRMLMVYDGPERTLLFEATDSDL